MKPVRILKSVIALSVFLSAGNILAETRFIQVEAHDRHERSAIANQGMSIEFVHSDSVWGFAHDRALQRLQAGGFKILSNLPREIGRGGHQESVQALDSLMGFPPADERYHTFGQVVTILQELADQNKDIARLQSIGKTIEGRDLWVMHLNSSPEALQTGKSNKPGAIFMGNHHAREHLSVEMPLMLIQHLLTHRADSQISNLLANRDIWILPMVNPDGAEFDIATGRCVLGAALGRALTRAPIAIDASGAIFLLPTPLTED